MWCSTYKNGCLLTVKLTPRASRNAILGTEQEWVRIALTAPPVDGKANAAARDYLAEFTGLPRANVSLVSGQTARLKRFYIATVSPEQMVDKITAAIHS